MDKDHDDHASLPIPTYEEAIASRPPSSQAHAEREGLLPRPSGDASNSLYHGPTVESARSSLDSDLSMPEFTLAQEEASLRRDMEEMHVEDTNDLTSTSRFRLSFQKRFTTIRHTLATFQIPLAIQPFSIMFVFQSIYDKIPSIPDRYRISLPIAARLFGLLIIGLLLYALLGLDVGPEKSYLGSHYDPESVRIRALTEVDGGRIGDYLRYITSYNHVAGTEGDLFLAKWQHEFWEAAGLTETALEDFYVFLNYPTKDGRAVTIDDESGKVIWTASLDENDGRPGDGAQQQQTLSFHGLSRSGKVTAHLVYANYGSETDYANLRELDIRVNGSIVLVRAEMDPGHVAIQIKAAELQGALGCLVYFDPKEDGFIRGKTIPNGPWSPADAVHRDSVALSRWVLGDVLTPGRAAKLDTERVSTKDNPGLVNIPSLPLAWRDAQPLLQAIRGRGRKVPSPDWIGGVPDVDEWWTGGPGLPEVTLGNIQDENKVQAIWNVHGVIKGAEAPEMKVIVGSHRDSWCFGSVDPGSGTAAMMEVVTVFSALTKLGWLPLRTIEFVGWDAGSYNNIGSTEHVEDRIDELRANAFAYLNVDAGVFGRELRASGSPLLSRTFHQVLDRLSDPFANGTLKESWTSRYPQGLPPPAAVGDFVPFQALAGVSSIDFGFQGEPGSYPAHSCYETFEWMEQYGDVGFEYHKILAQMWVLLILDLADRPILPFDVNTFAAAVSDHVNTLEEAVNTQFESETPSLQSLKSAAQKLVGSATEFHKFDDYWSAKVLGSGGYEEGKMSAERVVHNERLVQLEKNLLDLPGMFKSDENEEHGIPGRTQYKHVVFGPTAKPGKDDTVFPAIRDAIDRGDAATVQVQIDKVARIIERAAAKLLE